MVPRGDVQERTPKLSHIPPRNETLHVPEITFLALLWQRAGLGRLVVDQGAHGARAPPVRFEVDWDAALRVGGGWYNPGDEADYGGRVSVACRPTRTPPPNPNPNPYPDPNPPSPGGTMYSGGAAPPPRPSRSPPPGGADGPLAAGLWAHPAADPASGGVPPLPHATRLSSM